MIIVDAHQDIAYNAMCFNRDYQIAALRKRQLEAGSEIAQRAGGQATIGLSEAIVGRVAIIFGTLFVAPYSKNTSPWDAVKYRDDKEAFTLAQQQLDYYRRLADETERVRIIETSDDLDAVLATWQPDKSVKDRQQGIVLLMENADPIREPQQLELWLEQGLRIVGPAWMASRYSGGTGQPGALTDLGRELLDIMADNNMVLDVSHMAEDSFLESLDLYPGSIIASHSNPRKFCNTDRHLTDPMIRRLAERDGVMGVVLYNAFLDGTWRSTDRKAQITLQNVINIIDHICQVTGSASHVGIGSDFDGGFGASSIPKEIDTVADLHHLIPALRERGYEETDITAIMSGNMLRKLREGLPA